MSPISASSSHAPEDALGPTPSSDINTSQEIADGDQFENANAQPDPHTSQLNHKPESRQPTEEASMMNEDELSTGGNTQKQSWAEKVKKAAGSWWLWETGGAALSIGCMIAIVIIIPYIHNQPLKNWRFTIAPNTMISTLITVSKTSMLLAVATGIGQLKWQHFHRSMRPISELDVYDEASRGPWGAFAFILVSPFRWRDTVAILGAFVMLSSLTMEPLAQQLFSFQTQPISFDNGSAWISTTTSYLLEREFTSFLLEVPAQHAILQGAMGSPPPLSYICSSSNCSWSDFNALGVCSSCTDVKSDCTVKDIPPRDDMGIPRQVNYTTPKGISLLVTESVISNSIPRIYMNGNTTRRGMDNITDIVFVAIANASGKAIYDKKAAVYYYRQPDVTECKINWCAKFYSNLRMTNGTLNYTVDEESFSPDQFHGTMPDGEPLEQCKSYNYGNATFRATHGGNPYFFTVDCAKISTISRHFTDFFKFQVTGDDIFLASAQLIVNTESVSAAMDAITNALSTYMMTSTPNTTRHYGEDEDGSLKFMRA